MLKKAATYIAVKRLMADWARTRGMEGALQWFSNQWEDKYRELFQRDSGRHLADRFLSDLVSRPAVAVKLVESDSLHMVTPQELAMAILEERAVSPVSLNSTLVSLKGCTSKQARTHHEAALMMDLSAASALLRRSATGSRQTQSKTGTRHCSGICISVFDDSCLCNVVAPQADAPFRISDYCLTSLASSSCAEWQGALGQVF